MSKKGRHTSTIQNELLFSSLSRFFMKPTNFKRMSSIIHGTSAISLRLIDYFVTNYSRKYNIVITRTKTASKVPDYFHVYVNYRSQLKAFSKHLFDPFRRNQKITFKFDADNELPTTIGQMNFFRWAIESDVLEYIDGHYDVIVQDMNKAQKEEPAAAKKEAPLRKGSNASSERKQHVASKKTSTASCFNNMALIKGTRTVSFE